MIAAHPLRLELDSILHFACLDDRPMLPRRPKPIDEDESNIHDAPRTVSASEVLAEVTRIGPVSSAQIAARLNGSEWHVERSLMVMQLSGRIERTRGPNRVMWEAA